jgi:hypothetical protein
MPAKTVNEFSYESARSYLQTAVFVDDRIYETGTGKVVSVTSLEVPSRRKSAFVGGDAATVSTPSAETSGGEDPKGLFSAQDIVASFAEEGIVCGLYQPEPTESLDDKSSACKLCLGADIVIVDWDLVGQGTIGDRALDLIGALIKRSTEDIPEQLRLVMIYTGETNLTLILDRVLERLEMLLGAGVTPEKDESGDLALYTKNSRVIVRGKPGIANGESERVIPERELAHATVEEYSKLAAGLLQGSVLRALGEIRRNSRRILTRFDSSLDSAFLTHRALSLPHDDASDHVLPLVMGEVLAVLEDRLPHPMFNSDVLNSWVDTQWKEPPELPEGFPTGGDAKTVVKAIISKGQDMRETFSVSKNKAKDPAWIAGCLTKKGEGSSANEALSALMCLRTHYDSVTRTLRLGTILADSDGACWICIQPECDCVRLDGERNFLFGEIFAVTGQSNSDAVNLVVPSDSTFRRFRFPGKVFNSRIEKFAPDSTSRTVKAVAVSGKWVFRPVGEKNRKQKRTYSWLGQLKPDHAQRVAQVFAAELARVGVTESEWLRRMGTRP